MQPARPYRPKVSRETRLLLTAAVLAIAALWLLARIRFQGLPATPNPIPAVLSQLASNPRYDDLAGQLAQIQSRLQPSLLVVGVPSASERSAVTSPRSVAIKLRDDLIVTLVHPGTSPEQWSDATVLANDAASGLVVARVMTAGSMPHALPWIPRRLQQPRYVFATDVSPAGVSLRPVFIGSLHPIDTPLWAAQLWAVPAGTDLAPGAFLFTTDAELAGIAIAHGGETVIVPIATLLAEADRLLATPPGSGGTIGIDVQALTPPVAAASGAQRGVIVTSVDGDGAAAGRVMVGDVIESVDGREVATLQHWTVRVARLAPGETLALGVRRRGELLDIALVAAAPATPPEARPLGLTLRGRPGIGAEVVRVERASAAEGAGLMAGDVITLVAGVSAPSPTQVMRTFAAADQGQRILIAVTRGGGHFVTTLER